MKCMKIKITKNDIIRLFVLLIAFSVLLYLALVVILMRRMVLRLSLIMIKRV